MDWYIGLFENFGFHSWSEMSDLSWTNFKIFDELSSPITGSHCMLLWGHNCTVEGEQRDHRISLVICYNGLLRLGFLIR